MRYKMTNKPLNLLVIEDKEHHINDAKKYFASIVQRGIVNPVYAHTLFEAEHQLSASPDCIISDIFFPIGKTAEEDAATTSSIAATLRQELERILYMHQYEASMNTWIKGKSPPPAGIIVAQKALANKIPFVFNTDTYHHGNATQPIDSWRSEKRLAYVESGRSTMDESSPHKNWREAYAALASILEGDKYFTKETLYLPSKIKNLEQELAEAQKEGTIRLPSYAGWTIDMGRNYLRDIQEWLSNIKPIFDKYGIELNDEAQ